MQVRNQGGQAAPGVVTVGEAAPPAGRDERSSVSELTAPVFARRASVTDATFASAGLGKGA